MVKCNLSCLSQIFMGNLMCTLSTVLRQVNDMALKVVTIQQIIIKLTNYKIIIKLSVIVIKSDLAAIEVLNVALLSQVQTHP